MPPKVVKKKGLDKEVQTDGPLTKLCGLLNSKTEVDGAHNADSNSSAFVVHPEFYLKPQMIMAMHIRKLSEENCKLKANSAKFMQIYRAIRTQYETCLNNLKDESSALLLEQKERQKMIDAFIKQLKDVTEAEKNVLIESLKLRDQRITKFKLEAKDMNCHLALVTQAFEAEHRKLQVAQKEAFNSTEETRGIRELMNDKLFLAQNQTCMNCQVKEKIKENLLSEITTKTKHIETLQSTLTERDEEVLREKRIIDMITDDLKKSRYSEQTYKDELQKNRLKIKELEKANARLKNALGKGSSPLAEQDETTGSINSIELNILTPPEESEKNTLIIQPNRKEENKETNACLKDQAQSIEKVQTTFSAGKKLLYKKKITTIANIRKMQQDNWTRKRPSSAQYSGKASIKNRQSNAEKAQSESPFVVCVEDVLGAAGREARAPKFFQTLPIQKTCEGTPNEPTVWKFGQAKTDNPIPSARPRKIYADNIWDNSPNKETIDQVAVNPTAVRQYGNCQRATNFWDDVDQVVSFERGSSNNSATKNNSGLISPTIVGMKAQIQPVPITATQQQTSWRKPDQQAAGQRLQNHGQNAGIHSRSQQIYARQQIPAPPPRLTAPIPKPPERPLGRIGPFENAFSRGGTLPWHHQTKGVPHPNNVFYR